MSEKTSTQTPALTATDWVRGKVYFFSRVKTPPTLEIKLNPHELNDVTERVEFSFSQHGRVPGETLWYAEPLLPPKGEWQFRIELSHGTYAPPFRQGSFDFHTTTLRQLWLQHGQIYSYEPAPAHSIPRVVKVPNFIGSLPKRPLYVYLPRGYDQHTFKRYPVLYMHDGQNCFESFVGDSYSGSWRADEVATDLIAQGQMQETVIVGVSNGGHRRLAEYLPPYSTYRPYGGEENEHLTPIKGEADRTAAYYINEVAPFIQRYYRVLTGREHTGVCGSSMGGLFSMYFGWEHGQFAKKLGVLSPSFWITRDNPLNGESQMTAVERLRDGYRRDMRLWLDSGTLSGHTYGDDGQDDTVFARDILLENGYAEGENFRYYLDEGAVHHESAWAARLDKVFKFLFPL